MDRIPPQNKEIEESLLCALILDNRKIEDVVDILFPDDFYMTKHNNIYSAILQLHIKNEPFDLPSLTNKLMQQDKLEEIGGASYLIHLVDYVPLASDVIYYADQIKEYSNKRRLIEISSKTIDNCFDSSISFDEAIDKISKEVLNFEIKSLRESKLLGYLLDKKIKKLEELNYKKRGITGLSCGIQGVDNLTTGFQPTEYIILGARPSAGKTSLVLNILEDVAQNEGAALFFSLEMPADQLINKILARSTKLNSMRFRAGHFSKDEWMKIINTNSEKSDTQLLIHDYPDMHYNDIRKEARKCKKNYDLKLIVIDYIQLVKGDRHDNRVTELSGISANIKAMANELEVPVIALSQLNRKLEERRNKRPLLSDLRESGSLEQDADIVMFLYRDIMYNENANPKLAELTFAKNRNGITGTVKLHFVPEISYFYDPEPEPIS